MFHPVTLTSPLRVAGVVAECVSVAQMIRVHTGDQMGVDCQMSAEVSLEIAHQPSWFNRPEIRHGSEILNGSKISNGPLSRNETKF